MNEIWADIKDYEGLYQVSNFGRVKSVYKQVGFYTNRETILSPSVDKRGYLQVVLYKERTPRGRRVHRLVAETFVPNPGKKRTVNHIDKNNKNNHADNLEWATYQEQADHSFSKPILQLDLNGNIVKKWKSGAYAALVGGFHQGHINSCCNGKLKTHKGYKWSFI